MAKRSTPSDKILLDPLFPIPEGAEDQFAISLDGTDLDGLADSEVDNFYPGDEGSDDEEGLEPPENIVVVSQKLRRTKSGNVVIDVVFEIDEVEGATAYELQVTKT